MNNRKNNDVARDNQRLSFLLFAKLFDNKPFFCRTFLPHIVFDMNYLAESLYYEQNGDQLSTGCEMHIHGQASAKIVAMDHKCITQLTNI